MADKKQERIVRTGRRPLPPKVLRAASVMPAQSKHEVPSDVNGSYTGNPIDYEEPEQDADDL